MEEIGKKIRDMRVEKNISQPQLAKALNVSKGIISKWETGKNEPKISYIKNIANYFNISIDYLVGNANDEGFIVMQNELSDDENYLIDLVRQLNMKDKSTIYELAELMVQAKKSKKS